MGAVYGNIKKAIGELFEIDLEAGTTYYFWTVIGDSDGHIEDTNIQLLDADGTTVIAQNDNSRTRAHGSYMEYTAPDTIQDASIKVLPLQRSMRGSYQLFVSTTQPDLNAPPPTPPAPPGTTPPPSPPSGIVDSCTISVDSLEGYYNLNGDASDSSSKNRDGAWSGTEAYGPGVSGEDGDQAASFDGASFIDVDRFKNFNWGAQFSMSVWFQRVGCDGNYQGVIGNGYYMHGSWEVRMGREDAGCANADVWACEECAVGCTCSMLGGGVVTALHDTAGDHLSIITGRKRWVGQGVHPNPLDLSMTAF